MENFTEIFRFEKFFIYLKEERQKDKIIVADRRRELVFLKKTNSFSGSTFAAHYT